MIEENLWEVKAMTRNKYEASNWPTKLGFSFGMLESSNQNEEFCVMLKRVWSV